VPIAPIVGLIRVSPPPGSPEAAPIAMSVAGRKYHCPSAFFIALEVITLVFPLMILFARALFAVLTYLRDWLTVFAAMQGMYWPFLLFNFQGSNKFAPVYRKEKIGQVREKIFRNH